MGVVDGILEIVWTEFDCATLMCHVAQVARDPFRWHTVLQALMHGSTWPSTARGFTLLLSPKSNCKSSCRYCGKDSRAQQIIHSVFTVLNVPGKSSEKHFLKFFCAKVFQILINRDSSFRSVILDQVAERDAICILKDIPTIIELFSQFGENKFSEYFFSNFENSSEIPVSSFLILLGTKMWEAATVENGRNFDNIMYEYFPKVPIQFGKRILGDKHIVAFSAIEIVRHTLRTMFLPVSLWSHLADKENSGQLNRCTSFMELSVILQIIKEMLLVPGAIPALTGQAAKFQYVVDGIKINVCDISRAVCLLKPGPVLIVKDVSLQVQHSWRIDRQGSIYYGTNVVSVKGLSAVIAMSLTEQDGPSVSAATINLGSVQHQCKIDNANFVSGMLAQAALDWFTGPLTNLIQKAAQTSLEALLQKECEWFAQSVWKETVLTLFPSCMVLDIVDCINTSLPAHGVAI